MRVPLGRREVAGIVWDAAPGRRSGRPRSGKSPRSCDALPPLPPPGASSSSSPPATTSAASARSRCRCCRPSCAAWPTTAIADRLRAPGRGAWRARRADAAAADLRRCRRSSPAQADAGARIAAAMAAPEPATVLLHGVTGSGKTEVYLRAAERGARARPPGARARARDQPDAAARGALRRALRRPAHRRAAQRPDAGGSACAAGSLAHPGRADIVLGTRLAVFAPLPRLGLDRRRRGARPVVQAAGRRALLGARPRRLARPPRERRWSCSARRRRRSRAGSNADAGRYLRARPAGADRRRGLADGAAARHGPAAEATGPAAARRAGARAAARRGDRERGSRAASRACVFLNRRGYAPVLHCGECSWKSGCPHCSAWRVFHKQDRTPALPPLRPRRARCRAPAPTAATPTSRRSAAAPSGSRSRSAALLPGARIARIDADSTRRKGALEAQLGAVHAGEVDVLVGTQMIAKGHDFRRIGLVAAVNPDSSLFSSDFRAPERLFALLMQAAGRAGRDAAQAGASEMWVQTWHPAHPLYQALGRHDFAAFAASQLKERASAGLPPFSHLARAARRGEDGRRRRAASSSPPPRRRAALAESGRRSWSTRRCRSASPASPTSSGCRCWSSRRRAGRCRRCCAPGCRARRAARGAQRAEQRLLRWAVDVDPLTI